MSLLVRLGAEGDFVFGECLMKRTAVYLCAVMAMSIPVFAGIDNPFGYFNLYSAGDIGTSSDAYVSDCQGTVGAAGDVYFQSFSADVHKLNDYGLVSGGNATLIGGSYYQNVSVGGNLTVQNLDMNGNVYVGGNTTAIGGGTINGNLSSAGTISLPQNSFNVTGSTSSNQVFTSVVDFDEVTDYFSSVSSYYGQQTDTTGYVNSWGNIQITLGSGLNVVTMTAEEFKNAWGLTVTGASDGALIINLTGEIATLDSTDLYGIDGSKVLLNYVDATELNITNGNNLNVLAINADTNFEYGHIDGNLIVANLTGGGQINEGYFDPGVELVPEPATISILGLGALVLRGTGRRPRSSK